MKSCYNNRMKILIINGDRTKEGILSKAVALIKDQFEKNDIEVDIDTVGEREIHPCTACGKCIKRRICIFPDEVNPILEHAERWDGMIVGSLVQYGQIDFQIQAILDRLMRAGNDRLAYKIGGTLVASRRGETSSPYMDIARRFALAEMPLVLTRDYGRLDATKEELTEEDCKSLEHFVQNYIWMLQSIQEGKKNHILPSEECPIKVTDYMR